MTDNAAVAYISNKMKEVVNKKIGKTITKEVINDISDSIMELLEIRPEYDIQVTRDPDDDQKLIFSIQFKDIPSDR